jgi:hypothetical protein
MARRTALHPFLGVFLALAVMLLASPLQAQVPVQRGTAKPSTLKITVTQVELWNSTAWVSVFTGSAQLDLVAGGPFPGIANVTLPGGTYSKVRVTILNSIGVTGSVTYLGTPYYVTPAAGPFAGTVSATSNVASAGQNDFAHPFWGAAGAPFRFPDFAITPIIVTPSTNYAPSLKVDVTNALQLWEFAPGTFYFVLGAPTVTLI